MKNILEYLERAARAFPNKVAFSDETCEWTYSAFLREAQAVGTFLQCRVSCPAPVAVLLEKTAESLAALMGVVYSGNFYTVLDARMPSARMKKILHDLSPAVVLTDCAHEEQARGLSAAPVDLIEDARACPPDEAALRSVRRQMIDTDPVYVLFTSGSTGNPKGTVVSHHSVIAYAEWVGETFGLDENTIFGNQSPFYFSMSVLDIFSTLRNAATMQIIPSKYFAFPGRLVEYLTARKINTLYWVPSAMGIVSSWQLFAYNEPPRLKTVLFAGEVMPAKVLNYWRANLPDALFANLYGPTEVTDICAYYVVDRPFSNDESIPIGIACDNCGLLVVTPDGRKAGSGEEGELYVRGAFLGMGYYNNPQKTVDAFVQNPLNTRYPEVVYKTGDLVKLEENGELRYLGRRDFQIKHMGYRIELGEIEMQCVAIDGVESCACIYDMAEEAIILFYQSASVKEQALLSELRGRLPKYMLPSVLRRLKRIPYNANGKIDRVRLKTEFMVQKEREKQNGEAVGDPA